MTGKTKALVIEKLRKEVWKHLHVSVDATPVIKHDTEQAVEELVRGFLSMSEIAIVNRKAGMSADIGFVRYSRFSLAECNRMLKEAGWVKEEK